MQRLRFWLVVLTSLLLVSACQADYEYTRGKCYVVFDNSIALVPQLAAAMGGTPGVFCRVWKGAIMGVPAFFFADFTDSQQYVVFTAAQQKSTLIFGRNDSSGIIVGHTNFHGFRVFDMQCPVCSDISDFNPRVQLSWSTRDNSFLLTMQTRIRLKQPRVCRGWCSSHRVQSTTSSRSIRSALRTLGILFLSKKLILLQNKRLETGADTYQRSTAPVIV